MIRVFSGIADRRIEYVVLGIWECVVGDVEKTRLSLVDGVLSECWPR